MRFNAVSGEIKASDRREVLARFEKGETKVLYTQQLSRSIRLSPGKESLMVFVRRVDVQSETVERYVRDGLLVPDLVVEADEPVWKKVTREEKQEIERICDEKLEQYYRRFQAPQTEDAIRGNQ